MTIPVVFACNDYYVMPLCVAVTSMIYNKKRETIYEICVLHSGLSVRSKEKLRELESETCHIQILNVDILTEQIQKRYEEQARSSRISKETMYRFLIPQLFEDREKILYLDCDVFVQDDLEQLYSTNLGAAYAGVVTDIDTEHRIRALGKETGGYFNAGMLLMNLAQIRKDAIVERLLKEFLQGPQYPLVDQDILNIVLNKNVLYLPEKYNFLSELIINGGIERITKNYENMKYSSIARCLDDIVILHYADAKKPWQYELPYITDMFMKYYKLSNFSNYHLTLMPINMDSPMGKYLIPEFDIPDGSRIILYGAGNLGKAYFQSIIVRHRHTLVGWVDSKAAGYRLQGLPVELPTEVFDRDYDYVILGVMKAETADDIRKMLERMGIAEEKIKWEASSGIPSFQQVVRDYKRERLCQS